MTARLFGAIALAAAALFGQQLQAEEPRCLEPRAPACADPERTGWFADEASQLDCLDELERYTAQLREWVNCTSADAQARIGEAYRKYNCKVRRERPCR